MEQVPAGTSVRADTRVDFNERSRNPPLREIVRKNDNSGARPRSLSEGIVSRDGDEEALAVLLREQVGGLGVAVELNWTGLMEGEKTASAPIPMLQSVPSHSPPPEDS